MTEAEKKEIVALVMSEISGQAVDFDLQTVTPQRTDILPAVRPDGAGGYTGVTLDWGGITDELTTQAKGFRDEALQAKRDTELLKSETNGIKSEVNDIYTQFNQVVDSTIESVRNVYQSDLSAEATAREEADNALGGRIDAEELTRAEADTALGSRIDSEVTTRESEVAELERVNAIQRYEIENLKAKAEGQIYRTEVVKGEAYSYDVPSSVAPYAELQKIGGKSVVWNQIFKNSIGYVDGVTITNKEDGTITFNGTSTNTFINFDNLNKYQDVVGKFLFVFSVLKNENSINMQFGWLNRGFMTSIITSGRTYYIANQESKHLTKQKYTGIAGFPIGTVFEDVKIKLYNINLTQMFGEGNEPTLEECQKIFSADYYPYDAGTLKSFPVQRVKSLKADGTELGSIDVSSFTTDLKSAGSVHDEWENGKKISNVGVINLGDYNWELYAASPNQPRRFAFANSKLFFKDNMQLLCSKFVRGIKNSQIQGQIWTQDNYLVVTDVNEEWATESSFKQAVQGVLLYYELKTPTEEAIPEIDNYIQVEGGGSLTFESDETVKMPVPSTTRFVVDLT